MRIPTAVCCFVALVGTQLVSPTGAAEGGQFRSQTHLVLVPVSVIQDRHPVTGLTAADFEVTDNGVRQAVEALSLEHVPIDVTFLLTEFPADRDREFARILEAAGETRARLGKNDRLQLVIATSRVTSRFVDTGTSLAVLPEVRDLQTGRGFTGGLSLRRPEQTDLGGGWGIALADALLYALAHPTNLDRRHVIIAFTDGHNSASVLDMDTLPAIASRSDAVLHAVLWARPGDGGNSGGINFVGPPPSSRAWEASLRALEETVRRTGGTVQPARNASEALAEILTNFRSSYVLRYTPASTPKPGWHEIKVTVKRPGSFNIRARRGYEVSPHK